MLVGQDTKVKQAGGFIIQLMPGCSDETVEKLEEKLKTIQSVTDFLKKGMTPEDILQEILGDMGLEILDTLPAQFYCSCSRERMTKALITLGQKEITDMISDGKPVELNCRFCGRKYTFTVDELKEILRQSQA